MAICYYPLRKHLHSALAYCTLREIFGIILCVVAEFFYVASINNIPLVRSIVNTPRTALDTLITHSNAGFIS
jgi:hypothetical protein